MTLARSIREGATNHYQMSLAVLYENAPQVLADDRLQGVNPAGYDSFEQYVTFILLNGSPIQRSALLDNLDTLSDISMPEIKYLSREPALALLETYVRQTCQIMGCDFKGDLPTVVSGLYDDYGGVTIIEWARFFHGVTQGKYKDEYQSVNTRGLNAEFLRDWLDQFYERRDKIISTLRKEMSSSPSESGEFNSAAFEEVKRVQRETLALDGDVRNWRTEYEKSLTVTRMGRIVTTDEVDGKIITQESEVPLVEDLPEAAYTRLFDFISAFYAFDGQDVKQIIADMTVTWELERVIDFNDTDTKQFYRSRAKMLLSNLRKFAVASTGRAIIEEAVKKVASAHPLTGDFFQAITGKPYTGDKAHVAIGPYLGELASKLMGEFHDAYGTDARRSLESGSYVLYRDEYIALRCIHWSVKTAGMEHPFTHIFNISQQ
jgi:hypothetical protein